MHTNYHTCADIEALLRTALDIKGSSTKSIADAIGLKPNTLYKWKNGRTGLSISSLDRLYLYFQENEPNRLEQAAFFVLQN